MASSWVAKTYHGQTEPLSNVNITKIGVVAPAKECLSYTHPPTENKHLN